MNKVNCIDASYAGGEDGIEITNKMIKSAIQLLSHGGCLYLFLIEENNIKSVISEMEKENF